MKFVFLSYFSFEMSAPLSDEIYLTIEKTSLIPYITLFFLIIITFHSFSYIFLSFSYNDTLGKVYIGIEL